MAALLGTLGEGGRNKNGDLRGRVKTNCQFKTTSFSTFPSALMW